MPRPLWPTEIGPLLLVHWLAKDSFILLEQVFKGLTIVYSTVHCGREN